MNLEWFWTSRRKLETWPLSEDYLGSGPWSFEAHSSPVPQLGRTEEDP